MDARALESVKSYGLVSPEELTRLQAEANARAEAAARRSRLGELTYETALEDAHEAVVGLLADLSGTTERRGLKDMLLHGDRLRGLGILLVAMALLGMVIDAVLRAS